MSGSDPVIPAPYAPQAVQNRVQYNCKADSKAITNRAVSRSGQIVYPDPAVNVGNVMIASPTGRPMARPANNTVQSSTMSRVMDYELVFISKHTRSPVDQHKASALILMKDDDVAIPAWSAFNGIAAPAHIDVNDDKALLSYLRERYRCLGICAPPGTQSLKEGNARFNTHASGTMSARVAAPVNPGDLLAWKVPSPTELADDKIYKNTGRVLAQLVPYDPVEEDLSNRKLFMNSLYEIITHCFEKSTFKKAIDDEKVDELKPIIGDFANKSETTQPLGWSTYRDAVYKYALGLFLSADRFVRKQDDDGPVKSLRQVTPSNKIKDSQLLGYLIKLHNKLETDKPFFAEVIQLQLAALRQVTHEHDSCIVGIASSAATKHGTCHVHWFL